MSGGMFVRCEGSREPAESLLPGGVMGVCSRCYQRIGTLFGGLMMPHKRVKGGEKRG